jgi:hypothetical protein
VRRRAPIRHFGSVERFLRLHRRSLEGVPGVPQKIARTLYAKLHKAGLPSVRTRERGSAVGPVDEQRGLADGHETATVPCDPHARSRGPLGDLSALEKERATTAIAVKPATTFVPTVMNFRPTLKASNCELGTVP